MSDLTNKQKEDEELDTGVTEKSPPMPSVNFEPDTQTKERIRRDSEAILLKVAKKPPWWKFWKRQ